MADYLDDVADRTLDRHQVAIDFSGPQGLSFVGIAAAALLPHCFGEVASVAIGDHSSDCDLKLPSQLAVFPW